MQIEVDNGKEIFLKYAYQKDEINNLKNKNIILNEKNKTFKNIINTLNV